MNTRDLKKQGLKALKYLQDLDKDDVLDAVGLEEKSSGVGTFFGTLGVFALGALVGAGLGLAFAPKAGTEFRNELGEKMRKKADELRPLDVGSTRSHMPVT